MDKRIIARYIFRETMGVAIMGAALFWAAGTLDWWPAWAIVIVTIGWTVGTAIVILRLNPTLLAERLGPRKGAKAWDTAILGMLGIFQLARYIIAGLDHRYGWTGGFPAAAQIAGLILCALGYGGMVWATASTAFFSQIVRIQSERGHTVATGGPYRYVRHPGYAGAILYEIGAPVLLGSWPALLVSAIDILVLVLRTALEDRTLQKELNGYADFAQKVRYRLAPGVW